jgi:hypothetical protein
MPLGGVYHGNRLALDSHADRPDSTGISGASLLLMVYTPMQHHSLMADPFSGKIACATAWGYDEPCVFGQGVTQNKAHHAVILTEAHSQVRGTDLETYYGQGSFDAGGPCTAGVPAVMYGVGGGASMLGEDCVPLSQVIDEARVVVQTILLLLG